MSKNLWFKKKTYGWGWTPSTWQGWSVIGVYVATLSLTAWFVRTGFLQWTSTQLTIALLAESAVLVSISYAKGEKPSWSWGRSQ
jgi:hypothetical protein